MLPWPLPLLCRHDGHGLVKQAVTLSCLCSLVRWVDLAAPLRAMLASVLVGSAENTRNCVLVSLWVAPLGMTCVTRKCACARA